MKTAFLFPGQGAQTVGMCKDIVGAYPAAAEIFRKADEIVGYELSKVCFEGPAEKLNMTAISQPAIFTASAAILQVLRTESATSDITPDITAGLSLGEYSALYAAGVISFEDGLSLVRERGSAMQAAADATEGAMVGIIGLDEEKTRQVCEQARQGQLLEPVNFNCPGQIVVSGDVAACDRAAELATQQGAIKAVKLDVAGAFHTDMMSSAAEALRKKLESTDIVLSEQPKIIANVNAEYYQSSEEIVDGLTNQLTNPILWQKCMERLLADGVEKYYEIGPGRVLTGLARRINRKTRVINISSAESLNKVLQATA